MKRRKRLAVDQIWVTRKPETRTPSRRVILLANGKVCYSTGGDSSRWCKRAAFRLWIRTYDAKATRTTQKRSLTLRPQSIARAATSRPRSCEATA